MGFFFFATVKLSPLHREYKYTRAAYSHPCGYTSRPLGWSDTPHHTQTASGHLVNRRKPNNSGKNWKVMGTASFAALG